MSPARSLWWRGTWRALLATALALASLGATASRNGERVAGQVRSASRVIVVILLGLILAPLLLMSLLIALLSLGPNVVAELLGLVFLVLALGAVLLALVQRASRSADLPAAHDPGPPRSTEALRKREGFLGPLRYEGLRRPSAYRRRAAAYRQRIQHSLKTRRSGVLAERLASLLAQLRQWEERVGQLADRLAVYESDRVLQGDMREVPAKIARLSAQAAHEGDPEMRAAMERALASYREQYTQLVALSRIMRRTRYQLEETLAAIGVIYSQVRLLEAMDVGSARAARLAGEIEEQTQSLNDLLSAMSELSQSSLEAEETRVIQRASARRAA